MTSTNNQFDIDDYLLRLNKSIGNVSRIYLGYVHPAMAVMSAVFMVILWKTFKRMKENRSLFRILSAMVLLEAFGLLIRAPLLTWFLSDEMIFTDYLEYRYCEIFQRLSADVPSVVVNITGILRILMSVHVLILTFKPSKEVTWLSSTRIILAIVGCCILGVLIFVPNMYLTDFQQVKWFSKYNPTEQRDCCMVLPKSSVMNIEWFQRNAMLGSLIISSLPLLLVTIACTIVAVWKCRTKAGRDEENSDHKRVTNIMSTVWCLMAYTILKLPYFAWTLCVTLVYGKVDLGTPLMEVVYILSDVNMLDAIFASLSIPCTLVIFAIRNGDFKMELKGICGKKVESPTPEKE